MTTVISTPGASDFLALVPRLVGFPPTESIVFVAFRGTRTCAAIRFDLPGPAPAGVHRRIATSMVGVLSRVGEADAVVPVVYTDAPFAADAAPPHADFVDAALERFRFSGFRVRDALCVAGDGWGSYLDPDLPPGGRPLAEITTSPVHDAIPAAVRDRLGDLESWSALPTIDLVTKERVARRLAALHDSLGRAVLAGDESCPLAGAVKAEDDAEVQLARWMLDDLTLFAEDCIDRVPAQETGPNADTTGGDEPASHRIDVATVALLVHVAQSPALRDVLMLQWAFDLPTGDSVLEDARRYAAGEPVDGLASGGLMLDEGRRPDACRVERAVSLVKVLAASSPRAGRPPLLCMLAWLNWALGRSSVAHRFVSAAEQIDRRYGLAEVLRAVLDRGMLPEWAFTTENTTD
jgi:hypothetical protein